MLNEKKVKLMTKIAIYEKNEKEDLKIASQNFKVDYVTLHMLYTAITTTIGYVLLVLLYALGNLEELLVNSSVTAMPELISGAVSNYVVCLVVFLTIAFFFYSKKYDKAFKKVKREYTDLKNLTKLIEK